MIHVEVSDVIKAPRDRVYDLNANYWDWTKLFPDMKSVRLVRKEGDCVILEVDDVREGLVALTQRAIPPDRIEREVKRRSLEGRAVYSFESLSPNSTRMTLTFDVSLRGKYKLASLFARRIIVQRLKEFIFEPVKNASARTDTHSKNTV